MSFKFRNRPLAFPLSPKKRGKRSHCCFCSKLMIACLGGNSFCDSESFYWVIIYDFRTGGCPVHWVNASMTRNWRLSCQTERFAFFLLRRCSFVAQIIARKCLLSWKMVASKTIIIPTNYSGLARSPSFSICRHWNSRKCTRKTPGRVEWYVFTLFESEELWENRLVRQGNFLETFLFAEAMSLRDEAPKGGVKVRETVCVGQGLRGDAGFYTSAADAFELGLFRMTSSEIFRQLRCNLFDSPGSRSGSSKCNMNGVKRHTKTDNNLSHRTAYAKQLLRRRSRACQMFACPPELLITWIPIRMVRATKPRMSLNELLNRLLAYNHQKQ